MLASFACQIDPIGYDDLTRDKQYKFGEAKKLASESTKQSASSQIELSQNEMMRLGKFVKEEQTQNEHQLQIEQQRMASACEDTIEVSRCKFAYCTKLLYIINKMLTSEHS